MSKKRRNYMKQADILFSKYIRARDGRCQNCGSTQHLQCAHLIGRDYKSIRTDEDNAVALCRRCHMGFTHRPLEWRKWIDESFPGRYDRLKEKALRYEKVDWKAERDRLKELV